MLAVRTAFILTLALMAGGYVSCEQPNGSVMFGLHAFKVLIELGCVVTRFSFCSHGSGFQKPSKWLRNKSWYLPLEGKCTCKHKGSHFTVQGTFTRSAIAVFDRRCQPSAVEVYGRSPRPGEPVSQFSASYPMPLCKVMALGSRQAHSTGGNRLGGRSLNAVEKTAESAEPAPSRPWHQDPEWVEDICESLRYHEMFRYRFKQSGHINCLECRVYKTFLKHCAKCYINKRLVCLLDSRVTMGAAAKGRSSSQALSRILRSSLGYILGSGLYPGSLHCRSSWNRADGPSRGRDAPGPSREEPSWLRELRKGNLKSFDTMVTAAPWHRPIGRWFRLLLLIAGDVERHPGPPQSSNGRVPEYTPRGELDMMGGLSQATAQRMRKSLIQFNTWLVENAHLNLEYILQSAELCNLGLRAYGLALFREGKPRYTLVYTITAVQQIKPEYRRMLSGAWQVDLKWQMEEPGQCRAVLSAPVIRAILCLALLWQWRQFAGVVALGFGGMLHPNEFLRLTRRDLVFPEDAMMLEQSALYIFIKNPKTARFARRQHVRVDDRSLIFVAGALFRDKPLDTPLFGASTAVFRRQWNCLLDVLEIPRKQSVRGATPGTLRGSGATHEYLQSANLALIQWKGRWARLRTLEFYIQEVAAQLFLFNLSPKARSIIALLDAELAGVLQKLFPKEYARLCTAGQ